MATPSDISSNKKDIVFYRGDNSNISKLKLKDGQFIVGITDGKIVSIYMDTKDKNGNLIRNTIDLSDYGQVKEFVNNNNYSEKIASLENEIKKLKESIEQLKSMNIISYTGNDDND